MLPQGILQATTIVEVLLQRVHLACCFKSKRVCSHACYIGSAVLKVNSLCLQYLLVPLDQRLKPTTSLFVYNNITSNKEVRWLSVADRARTCALQACIYIRPPLRCHYKLGWTADMLVRRLRCAITLART
jgi:hypothetical protein